MAPLIKSVEIHDPDDPFLPEDILDHVILPRLPFKTLKRFQCISKRYRSLIAHDILFASEQAKLLSPSSSVLMRFSNNALSFPTNPEFVGLPDPSLKFLNEMQGSLSAFLRCSANGLLLFSHIVYPSVKLYLCNPATQEKVSVPMPQGMDGFYTGLAFDPSIAPNMYKLVEPFIEHITDSLSFYQFVVFRSDTGECSLSKEKVHVSNLSHFSHRIVHTKGVIYWHFREYIMWYNTEKDLAGSVLLPSGPWSINVYAGSVVCCRCNFDSGLEVWRLTNGTQLDRLHCFSWDCIVLPFDLYHMIQSCVDDVEEFDCRPPFNPQQWLRTRFPLAFDGQFVYIADSPLPVVHMRILWGYNICTQQLEKKGMMLMDGTMLLQLFDYHSSMAPVPKILERPAN